MITIEELTKRMMPISKWLKDYEDQAAALSKLFPSSHVVPEGGDLLDSYIELLQDYIGDTGEWIAYYVFECSMGAKPMQVRLSKDSEEIELDSIEKLHQCIFFKGAVC